MWPEVLSGMKDQASRLCLNFYFSNLGRKEFMMARGRAEASCVKEES